MRLTVRIGLVLFGAAGFCVALAAASSADVVDPESAYQPASTGLVQESPSDVAANPVDQAKDPAVGEAALAEAPAPEPTPAPESQVRQAPALSVRASTAADSPSADAPSVFHPFRAGLRQIESYLGRVVSACRVGTGPVTGGPVIVLAVLGAVVALARRRVFWATSATDEDALELLYAWEISPPG